MLSQAEGMWHSLGPDVVGAYIPDEVLVGTPANTFHSFAA